MSGMLSDLSDEARRHSDREEWGQYRNVRYDTAEYVRGQGEWKRAGFLYVEVLIFDLQGVTSAPGGHGFHPAYCSSTPSVAREVARFTRRAEMGKEELRTVFERVADQSWLDAFPRSRSEVWDELWTNVRKQQTLIELEEKVDALGPDQLLSEAEAEEYIEHKSEYELIRRVERILENEDPTRVPREKQNRARTYLAAVDPDALPNRWKAKAYRRGGEIMLSRDGRAKALEYFENALKAADPDERPDIERMVKRLRREVGQ